MSLNVFFFLHAQRQSSVSVVIFISCWVWINKLLNLHKLPPTTQLESQSGDYITWFDTNYIYRKTMKLIHNFNKGVFTEQCCDVCWDTGITALHRGEHHMEITSFPIRWGIWLGCISALLFQTHSASLFPDWTDPYLTDSISKDWWFIIWLSWDTHEREI